MRNATQKGIVYYKNATLGKSHSLLFLRINKGITASQAGKALFDLWEMYSSLEKGMVDGLSQTTKNLYPGNLSIQVGYSPKVFDLPGAERNLPSDLKEPWKFNDPGSEGGGPVIDRITLNYARELKNNDISADHVIFQFTGDNQFVVTRPIVETWKVIQRLAMDNGRTEPLRIERFYTGFKRDDKRGWLGFHDGISTLKYTQRTQAVFVNRNNLSNDDLWTLDGTYLSFLRIAIDLGEWDKLDLRTQELIIGREKLTGCPITRVSQSGEPIKDTRCPKIGTTEVTEKGNELFREQSYRREVLGYRALPKKLDSHVGRNLIDSRTGLAQPQHRVFRQSFHFIESSNEYPGFIVGLNFISYQNRPENFFRSLRYGFGDNSEIKPVRIPNLGNYFSVQAAGLFLVPPYNEKENFPGSSIFYSKESRYNTSQAMKKTRERYRI